MKIKDYVKHVGTIGTLSYMKDVMNEMDKLDRSGEKATIYCKVSKSIRDRVFSEDYLFNEYRINNTHIIRNTEDLDKLTNKLEETFIEGNLLIVVMEDEDGKYNKELLEQEAHLLN